MKDGRWGLYTNSFTSFLISCCLLHDCNHKVPEKSTHIKNKELISKIVSQLHRVGRSTRNPRRNDGKLIMLDDDDVNNSLWTSDNAPAQDGQKPQWPQRHLRQWIGTRFTCTSDDSEAYCFFFLSQVTLSLCDKWFWEFVKKDTTSISYDAHKIYKVERNVVSTMCNGDKVCTYDSIELLQMVHVGLFFPLSHVTIP